MLDVTTVEGRMAAAAMRLAAERPWGALTLRDIADAAGLTLADLRGSVDSKAAVLAAFQRAVDDHVLRTAPRPDPAEPARDRLFEVIMCRLDALAHYKAALKSVAADVAAEPVLIRTSLTSQAWMLQAAGINPEGIGGGIRTMGLAALYAQVLRVWLEDDDPGLARTMAALDRRLRRGEQALGNLDGVLREARRVAKTLGDVLSGVRSRSAQTSAAAEGEAAEPPPEPPQDAPPEPPPGDQPSPPPQ